MAVGHALPQAVDGGVACACRVPVALSTLVVPSGHNALAFRAMRQALPVAPVGAFGIAKRHARHLQARRGALWAAPHCGGFSPPAPVAGNAWRRGGQRLSSSQIRMAALVHARTYVKLSLR